MKSFLFLFILFTLNVKSQSTLNFNKRFIECEDKWVSFNMNADDSSYTYGFIYIDEQAGLTFNYEGTFKISDEGIYIPKRIDSIGLKMRLEPNQVRVALLPRSKYSELKIAEVPIWLQHYKKDTLTIKRLIRWGYYYNIYGESSKALLYLEKAQSIDPKFEGLDFELAYAYNELGQYEKTIPLLVNAIKTNPNECFFYKELSLAEMKLGQIKDASKTSENGFTFCKDDLIKAEISYNLAIYFYEVKDQVNFNYWANNVKKWSPHDHQFYRNITSMNKNLKK